MSNINIVQFGANIGKSQSDAVWVLIEKSDSSALFVEPNLECFKLLKEHYSTNLNHAFEQAAITPTKVPEGVTLYHPAPEANLSVFGSLSATHRPENVVPTIVPALTTGQLFEKHNLLNKDFDLLQIDIEGMKTSVICSIDFRSIRPNKIRFEKIHLKNDEFLEINNYLNKNGYYQVDDFIWEIYNEYLLNNETLTWTPEPKNINCLFRRLETK